MDHFLVLNPGSRSFRGMESWPTILDRLRRAGTRFDYAFTRTEADAARLAGEADAAGFDAVVAVGGDGTINGVLNGLVRPGMDRARAAFGVLYTGTSPDFCNRLGIPTEPLAAVDALISGRSLAIDLGRIAHASDDGKARIERVFGCSANFGLGAAIARGSNSGLRKTLGDAAGTLVSTVRAIARYRPSDFIVEIDGERRTFPGLYNLFVGKNPLIASGIKLDLAIAPDDGRLFFLPLHGIGKGALLASLADAYTGKLARRHPPLFGATATIHAGTDNHEVEYDGDPRGMLPARVSVLPRAITVLGTDFRA